MINRQLAKSLKDTLQYYPILSLTGPRQSGKTTLLKNLFPDYRYINFEDNDTRRFFMDDPKGFLKNYDKYVIFDEAHRVPELFSYLQVKTDNDKIMGQYILSGSQNFLLLEKITQSLAGRVAIFRLLPLSHAELTINIPNLLPSSVEDAIHKGGYPTIYDRNTPLNLYFQNYMETYVERDARSLINIKDLNTFQQFIRLCAGRVGQLLNIDSLGRETGISSATVKNWLSILEASYIVFQLPPFFENFNKRLVKSTKLYFYDTGLLCYLLGIDMPSQMVQFYLKGSLFENMFIVELMKNRWNENQRNAFYFWQDSNKIEVDLVEITGLDTNLYEMKYNYTPSSQFVKGIKIFREYAPEFRKQGKNYVIYAGDERQLRTDAIFEIWSNIKDL